MSIEPFGYFRALPFGWDSCGENDEGAMPLYDQKTIDELLSEIEELECHTELLENQYDYNLLNSDSCS